MFPVIADENIDPIELNKKVTYGFTGIFLEIGFFYKSIIRMVK